MKSYMDFIKALMSENADYRKLLAVPNLMDPHTITGGISGTTPNLRNMQDSRSIDGRIGDTAPNLRNMQDPRAGVGDTAPNLRNMADNRQGGGITLPASGNPTAEMVASKMALIASNPQFAKGTMLDGQISKTATNRAKK